MSNLATATAVVIPFAGQKKARATKNSALKPEQLQCIQMLLEGKTHDAIAAELNIGRVTIIRWKKNKKFAAEYARQSKAMVGNGMNKLRANLESAVKVLVDMANDPEKANRIQLDAAKHIIKIVLEDAQLSQVAERLEKLEQSANREP